MQYLEVKNWREFQHYKERNPPWIKVHQNILNDYEFSCLQDASKLHLMLIWVLASQLDNRIPNDEEWLIKKLPINGKLNLKELIDKGFLICLQSASAVQASCTPETYREETETDVVVISDFQKVYDFGCKLFPSLVAKNTSEINKWLKAGCDPDIDILETIKASAGRDISTWTYFSKAIMNAKATRETLLPKGTASNGKQRQPSNTDRNLAALLAAASGDSPDKPRTSAGTFDGGDKALARN